MTTTSTMHLSNLEKIDAVVTEALKAARCPGAAVAVVAEGNVVFMNAYGLRDVQAKLPMTVDVAYPIASATKALNSTLIGMLVDDSLLAWDRPVQSYLPLFRLADLLASTQVTLRDLITMRVGLPRHDWIWIDHPIGRAQLLERLPYLPLACGLRERFLYNNLTGTIAGHAAELVAGTSWEQLIRERILEPLGMTATGFCMPENNATLSYHETSRRELVRTLRMTTSLIGPAGGSIHSTVADMARWMLFNLNGGNSGGRALIKARTLKEIHTPQVVMGPDHAERRPNSTYALGWSVDTYHGWSRLSHGCYLHDVDSEITLFPQAGVGIVSFNNFGPPAIALPLNQQIADLVMGFPQVERIERHLSEYERKIGSVRAAHEAVPRVIGTMPAHPLDEYAGVYRHPAYGRIVIRRDGELLTLHRTDLTLRLQHWHYDIWVPCASDLFPIHQLHAFDQSSRLSFGTAADGQIACIAIQLEPAVAPIRFDRLSDDVRGDT